MIQKSISSHTTSETLIPAKGWSEIALWVISKKWIFLLRYQKSLCHAEIVDGLKFTKREMTFATNLFMAQKLVSYPLCAVSCKRVTSSYY